MPRRLAFDVAILGDGPAAAATAFPLAEAGARVAIVDPARKRAARMAARHAAGHLPPDNAALG